MEGPNGHGGQLLWPAASLEFFFSVSPTKEQQGRGLNAARYARIASI
jgi:hypothetical protein